MNKAINKLKEVAIFTRNPEECLDIIGKLIELGLPIEDVTLKRFKERDSGIIPRYYLTKGLYIDCLQDRYPLRSFMRVEAPRQNRRSIKYIEFIGLYLKAKEEMDAEINRGDWNPKG